VSGGSIVISGIGTGSINNLVALDSLINIDIS